MRNHYQVAKRDIAASIRVLLNMENVVANRPAVDAGLAVLNTGGDFTDGVIAYDGSWLGGKTFVSSDKKAVALLIRLDKPAQLL